MAETKKEGRRGIMENRVTGHQTKQNCKRNFRLVRYRDGQTLVGGKLRLQIEQEIDAAVAKVTKAINEAVKEAADKLEAHMKEFEPRDKS